MDEGGGGARRVAGDLLPDPLAQRDLGELALVAQPLLDLGAARRTGLVSVPPTGLGKSACRRRQLLTAARPTPASLAIPAAVTSVELSGTGLSPVPAHVGVPAVWG